jgi:hypothetical protein
MHTVTACSEENILAIKALYYVLRTMNQRQKAKKEYIFFGTRNILQNLPRNAAPIYSDMLNIITSAQKQ